MVARALRACGSRNAGSADGPVRARRPVHAGVRPAVRRAHRSTRAATAARRSTARPTARRSRTSRRSVEAHVTGFVKDPLIDPVRPANGGALYAEYARNPTRCRSARAAWSSTPTRRQDPRRRHREVLLPARRRAAPGRGPVRQPARRRLRLQPDRRLPDGHRVPAARHHDRRRARPLRREHPRSQGLDRDAFDAQPALVRDVAHRADAGRTGSS